MQSIDPATGRVTAEHPEHSSEYVDERLEAAASAQRAWARRPLDERTSALKVLAERLRTEKADHAELIVSEMGKTRREAEAEIEKCAWVLEYYASETKRGLVPVVGATDFESYIRFDPLGLILAIMPWNFPYWQVFRFAAPALAAGNAVLLKHAENTTGCALAIERLLADGPVPRALFSTLVVDVARVPALIEDRRVAGVTLTGSTRAGRKVAEMAGRNLKKTVLELGGSDPYVVLEDANLENAVPACAASRLLNAGQSCIAAKRFIVLESVRAEFEERLIAHFESVRFGPPRDSGTDMGPLARKDLRDSLHDQVLRSVEAGAKRAVGGEVPEGPGWFYPATVLTQVRPGMPAHDEELFGPVASVIAAEDEEDALEIANRSVYGLGGAVFTQDRARAERFAAELQTGAVAINDFVRSDPRLPFGGIKDSGFGRELAEFGLREFVNIKTVTLKKASF